jgi:hypothetical protein
MFFGPISLASLILLHLSLVCQIAVEGLGVTLTETYPKEKEMRSLEESSSRSSSGLTVGFGTFGIRSASVLALFVLTLNFASVATAQSSEAESGPLEIHHVVHVLGFGDFKPESKGNLVIDGSRLTFIHGKSHVEVPLHLIRAFSIGHDNVALIGGAKGVVAGLAPYGAGQAITMIRPGVDTFTLLYVGADHAMHGAVLLLPKGKGYKVTGVLVKGGASAQDYPQTGPAASLQGLSTGTLKLVKDLGEAQVRRSVQVALPTETVDGIPPQFPIGLYEDLIAQLSKSGAFENVWRQGDARADSDALTLHVDILQLKKGSARLRGLVPFAGPTVIKARVRLTDASNRVLLDKDMSGAERLRGENIVATKHLSKKIERELAKLPAIKPPNPKETIG